MHIYCLELWDQLFTCKSTSNKTSKYVWIAKTPIPVTGNKHTGPDQDGKAANLKMTPGQTSALLR